MRSYFFEYILFKKVHIHKKHMENVKTKYKYNSSLRYIDLNRFFYITWQVYIICDIQYITNINNYYTLLYNGFFSIYSIKKFIVEIPHAVIIGYPSSLTETNMFCRWKRKQ